MDKNIIKILVVDDELNICDGIKRYIMAREIPVDEIVTSNNSLEACDIALRFKPNILITDVVMPNMDGIELANKLKDMDNKLKIILISGHEDINFVKSAFKLGAIDYIFKPIDITELEDVLNKVIDSCKYENENSEQMVRESINIGIIYLKYYLKGEIVPNSDFNIRLACLGINENKWNAVVCFSVSSKCQKEELNNLEVVVREEFRENGITVFRDKCQVFSVISFLGLSRELCSRIENIIARVHLRISNKIRYSVGVGNVVKEVYKLRESYLQACEAAINSYMSNDLKPIFYASLRKYNQTAFVISRDNQIEIYCAIYQKNELRMDEVIDEIKNKIKIMHNINIIILENIRFEIISLITRTIKEVNFVGDTDYNKLKIKFEELIQLSLIDDIIEWMHETLHCIYNSYHENGHNETNIVEFVRYIINNEFSNPQFDVQYIADKIKISPNYLSTYYKSHTGKKLNEHITECRLDYAKKLLEDKNRKLGEICVMVGIEDQNYFSRLFKKHNGYSPSEFREMISC